MFDVGEKVVYPFHGTGDIIEIKRIDEVEYILMEMQMEHLYIRIPREHIEKFGLRKPAEKSVLEDTLIRVGKSRPQTSDNWNLRYKENLSRMKTGQLDAVAEVVKILMEYEKKKKLSYIESRMYYMAKQIVLSEMCLVCELNAENAENLLAMWMEN